MYEKRIFAQYIIDHLLQGLYKKVAVTGAKGNFDILKLNYGEDHSKVLPDNKTVREEVINGLVIFGF